MGFLSLPPVTPTLLRALTRNSGLMRSELQLATGASGATIARVTMELSDAGLLSVSTGVANGKGRPAETISLAEDGLCTIGVSIRTEQCVASLITFQGECIASEYPDVNEETPYVQAIGLIGNAVLRLAAKAADSFRALGCVSIIFFGSCSYEHGEITTPSTFQAWHHKPIAHDLARYTALPCAVMNYSFALVATLNWFSEQDFDDFFIALDDYSIGGMCSIHGEPYLPYGVKPSSFSHTNSRRIGKELCRCGGYDCLSVTSSVRAIRAEAGRQGLISPGRTDFANLIRDLDGHDDPRARLLLDSAGAAVARAALNVCRGIGFRICIFGGLLFDCSAAAREAAQKEFYAPGHSCATRFLSDVFHGKDIDNLTAAALCCHHLSKTRQAYLLDKQQDYVEILTRQGASQG